MRSDAMVQFNHDSSFVFSSALSACAEFRNVILSSTNECVDRAFADMFAFNSLFKVEQWQLGVRLTYNRTLFYGIRYIFCIFFIVEE